MHFVTVVVLGVIALGVSAHGQRPQDRPWREPLALFATPINHVATTYAAQGRDGAYLIYTGEPFSLKIDIVNQSDAPATISYEGPNAGFVFRTTKDGMPFSIPITVSNSPSRLSAATLQAESWTGQMMLSPREMARWTADMAVEKLPPGLYQVDVEVLGTVEGQRGEYRGAVRRHVPLQRFEIRAQTPDAAEELALRRAMRLVLAREPQEAEAALLTMISRFPNSAMAYSLLGDVLSMQQRRGEAAQAYRASVKILSTGADATLLKWRSQGVSELIGSLSQQIDLMEGRRKE